MKKEEWRISRRDPEQPDGRNSAWNTGSHGADSLSKEVQNLHMAQRMLAERRLRSEYFDPALFGEPAWDMLLAQYVRDSTGDSSTADQLHDVAGLAPSSADRWLQYLETQGLLLRHTRPSFPGAEFVELTPEARLALERCLAAALKLPLPQWPKPANT